MFSSLYLLKGVLVVPDHELCSDKTQERDESVHVTESEVSDGTVGHVVLTSCVQTESPLTQRELI